MAAPSSVLVRIVLWLLGVAAGASAIAGAGVGGLGLVVRTLDLGEASPVISRGLISIGGALFGSAVVALVVARARPHTSSRPTTGIWLALLSATLIGLPVLLVVQLGPLTQFWQDVVALGSRLDVWQGANSNAAGLVLVPAAAVLLVPAIQALTGLGLMTACALLLLPLAIAKSAHIVRVLAVAAVLLGGAISAGAFGVNATAQLGPTVERLIRETPDRGGEQAQARALVERYQAVTRTSALTLLWSWAALFAWLPVLTLTTRVGSTSQTASASAPQPLAPGPDPSQKEPRLATANDRERALAYRDAAGQVDRSSRPLF